jgi:hypothetical protein
MVILAQTCRVPPSPPTVDTLSYSWNKRSVIYSGVPVGGPGDGVLPVRVVLLPLPLHILPNISTYRQYF